MIPSLPQECDVVIRQLDMAATQIDPDTREPVGEIAYKDPVTVSGQPQIRRSSALVEGSGGLVPSSDGHVMFLSDELEAAGLALAKGDLIMSIGGLEYGVDGKGVAHGCMITEVQPKGHMDGEPTMYMAFFVEVARGI